MHVKSDHTIEEYLLFFQQGDDLGFDHFFRKHYPALCSFAFRFLKNMPAAKDVVSDCYIKLWDRHASFHSPQTIVSFLYISIRNACLNLLRQERRMAAGNKEMSYLLDESEVPEMHEVIRAEKISQIYTIINSLPAGCRQVIKMLYVEGKNYKQIAAELDLSVHTIRNHRAKGISLIKKRLPHLVILVIYILIFLKYR